MRPNTTPVEFARRQDSRPGVKNLHRVNRADNGRVVVIEYEVHGTILATGAGYDNRFCSIIELENRKIAHWRDYMDSLAAWKALMASAD